MFYAIRVLEVAERPTAVVARSTTWDEFPSLWPKLLDVVHQTVGTAAGSNVILYRDNVPNVEVGVEVRDAFTAAGEVTASVLPAGRVATAVHRGPYDELSGAHVAMREWCAARAHRITGTRWEVYGEAENPADLETEVFYLLEP